MERVDYLIKVATIYYDNGDKYTGDLYNMKKHGKGKYMN